MFFRILPVVDNLNNFTTYQFFLIDKYICFDLPLVGFAIACSSSNMFVFVDPLNPWSSTIFLKVLLESYVNDKLSLNTRIVYDWGLVK